MDKIFILKATAKQVKAIMDMADTISSAFAEHPEEIINIKLVDQMLKKNKLKREYK